MKRPAHQQHALDLAERMLAIGLRWPKLIALLTDISTRPEPRYTDHERAVIRQAEQVVSLMIDERSAALDEGLADLGQDFQRSYQLHSGLLDTVSRQETRSIRERFGRDAHA